MGIFNFKKKEAEKGKYKIYIAEDNPVYLKQLEFFLTTSFKEEIEVSCFPVAEVIDVKLAHGHIPDAIIMDHQLNDKYEDADSGLNAIKAIHQTHPTILLILHSAYEPAADDHTNPDLFVSIPKREGAMEEIKTLIRQHI